MQPLESVRHAATHYLAMQAGAQGAHSTFDAGALDPRLRLAPCPTALEAFAQPTANTTAARITVGVRCNAGARWTVYVPVTVSSDMKVLVLRQSVQRGAHITGDDVVLEERHMAGLASQAVSSLDALAGRHLRASLAGGTALSVDMLVSDSMIKRGQQVTLIASVGGIEVRATGEALSEVGATGRVRVQNLSSMRIVEGVAESGDRVRVSP
jgi:flagella basal body P-ring formation protein FlgA